MNEIKIDKGIPIPKGDQGRPKWKSLFQSMAVGDSIAIPKKQRSGLASLANRYGIKVVTRYEGDHARMWRVADEVNGNASHLANGEAT